MAQNNVNIAETNLPVHYDLNGPRNLLANYKLPVHVRRSNFRLPSNPSTPVIMIGPGTGVAPFRGFIRERVTFLDLQKKGGNNISLGKHLLFYGSRNTDDFLYQEEWPEYAKKLDGSFEMVVAHSRLPNTKKVYVQDKLKDYEDQVFEMINNGAFIYVCGDAKGMAKRIFGKLSTENFKNIGISNSIATLEGFTLTLASLMVSLKTGSIPHFLPAVPRQRVNDLDVLIIDSWRSFKMLNGSEDWYRLIIVCDDPTRSPELDANSKVTTWKELVEGFTNDTEYQYTPPDDNSDDKKPFAYVTSPWNGTNSFNQICLVSNIAEFIKGFPLGNELNKNEHLTISSKLATSSTSLQIWGKLFAVLLHGGCASFINPANLDCKSLQETTLLFIETRDVAKLLNSSSKSGLLNRICLSWATNLLSEGIFTKIAKMEPHSLDRLRCVYLTDSIKDAEVISTFPEKIPILEKKNQRTTPSTKQLNKIRAQLASRVVLELYCPYAIMGPVAHTNFYDYRVFEKSVDDSVVCYGTLSTNLEGKMVETETNPRLNIEKRQGMLCIRGFSIGKPVELDRLEKALHLAERFGGCLLYTSRCV